MKPRMARASFYRPIVNNVDVGYFVKFVLAYCLMYYFTYVYIALADPKGMFSISLLHDHYINYLSYFETAIMKASNFFAHLFGLNSYVTPGPPLSEFEAPPILKIDNGASIVLSNGCIGLGIASFWLAFVLVSNNTWAKKISWMAVGLMAIFLLNSLRIAVLLYALQTQWHQVFAFIDHHTLFNITSYLFIFLLSWSYTKNTLMVAGPNVATKVLNPYA